MGQEFIKPTEAVPILTPGWRGAIAELGGHSPVQESGSGSARLVRDGIEYQLGLHPAGNDHRATRQKRWVLNGATPEHDAVPGGCSFAGKNIRRTVE